MDGEVKELRVSSKKIRKEALNTNLNKHPTKVLCCSLEHLPGTAGRAPPAAQQLDNQGSVREHSSVMQSSNTSTEIH